MRNKRTLMIAAFLVVLFLVLAACSSKPPPDYGWVIGGDYRPEQYVDHPPIYIPGSCSGNPPICSAPIIIPGHTEHITQRWRLRIVNPNDPDHKAWVVVSEGTFQATREGQCWDTKAQRTVELACDKKAAEAKENE